MNFDEIVVKDSPGLCRCCLSEGCYKDLGTEYTWMNENEVYADMLLECFDISISQHTDGPNGSNRLICEVCITRLRDACNFKKQVLDSEKKFVDMLARGEFQTKMIMYQAAPMKTEELLEEPAAEDVEYLEDLDYEDDLPLNQVGQLEASVSDLAGTVKVKGKRGRPKKTSSPVKTEKKPKISKMDAKPQTSKAVAKDEPTGLSGYTTERRRKNLQVLFNNTSVMPFKWKGKHICFYCGETFAEYPHLKEHTTAHGPCTTKDYSLKIIKGNHIEIKIDVSDISCKICSEPFPKLDEIVDHLIVKHNLEYDKSIDTPLLEYRLADCRCLYCDQQFAYFGKLVSHVNADHPQNCFICNECGATYNKKRDLGEHIRSNHREGGYTCKQCAKVFETKGLLIKHQNNYHFRRCKHCSASFSSKLLLQKHIGLEHPNEGTDESRQCKYCLKEVHTKQGLKQHLNKCKVKMLAEALQPQDNTDTCHDVNIEPRRRQNVAVIRHNIVSVLNMSTAVPFRYFTAYVCFYCTRKYVDFEELRSHTLIEHPVCDLKSKCIKKVKGERTTVKIDVSCLSCKVCSRSAQDLDELLDHITRDHNVKYDRNVSGCFEPFKIVKDNIPCLKCPQTFRYFGILLRHINSTHSGNKGICDFCGRSFKNLANLKVHISHAHTDSIECDVCSAKFRNQWCLSRHKAKHHDAKDFKCPKCPEKFQSQYQKQKHLIKTHGEGHKCVYCGRMFTRNSFMKDHIRRTHLKEKNVPCSVCNEKFFDNYLLRMHMAKHEGDRKFVCTICGKTFLRKSNLYSHMEMHKKYGHVQNESNISE